MVWLESSDILSSSANNLGHKRRESDGADRMNLYVSLLAVNTH